VALKLDRRYKLGAELGHGGMGVVYLAFDSVVRREVAIKTLRDAPSSKALEMFYRECDVLARMSHPNIVEIFDRGEFEQDGVRKPYFVMPRLPGETLERLIRSSSQRLNVERSVEIFTQICRGLHAAHENGLVHRDMKPSNIFVMDDYSVKIIDFGVTHMMVDSKKSLDPKGTLLYMAPEQLERKPVSPLTDVFALGIICYETLTQRRPFERKSEEEIVEAILHHIPPPVSEINPGISLPISRVVHKAMAKQPYNRFASAADFSQRLQEAFRNEPIEIFSESRIRPRIARATNAYEQGDYQYANEILSELEAEGHVDPAISQLRRQTDQTIRQRTLSRLLESARKRFDEGEYLLARQKVQEIFQLDADNAAALGLQSKIESKSADLKIEEWFRLAHEHINNYAYRHAREALQNVIQLRPKETRALQMLAEVDHQEQEYLKLRKDKERNYQAALNAWQNGDVSAALVKLESVLALEVRAPDSTNPERAATYQNFYNQVRSEHDSINNSYAEARRYLVDRNFPKALAICDMYLKKYPAHALFQALRFDIEEQQRQELSAYIAEIDRSVEAEPDLDRRVSILAEAVGRHPGEVHFERSLRLTRDKKDLVDSIVAKARHLEEQRNFGEALGQWEILRNIYSRYPGLDLEVERVTKRRDQLVRTEAKGRWVGQLEHLIDVGDYARTLDLLQSAEAEFPGDEDFAEFKKRALQGLQSAAEAQELLTRGQELLAKGQSREGLSTLRAAYQLDGRNSAIRGALLESLVENARTLLEDDNWRSAEPLLTEALVLDPNHGVAKSLRTSVSDHKREEAVSECLAKARQLRADGDLKGAQAEVRHALAVLPDEPTLLQFQATVDKALSESRRRDFEEIRRLQADVDAAEPGPSNTIRERTDHLSRLYPDDHDMQTVVARIRHRLTTIHEPGKSHPERRTDRGSPQSSGPIQTTSAGASDPARHSKLLSRIQEQLGTAVAGLAESFRKAASGLGLDPGSRIPKVWWLSSLVIVIVLVAGVVYYLRGRREESPQVTQTIALYPYAIQTTPQGATIRVNNEVKGMSPLELQLLPGSYDLEITKEGFQTARQAFTVSADSGTAPPLMMTLVPVSQSLLISSDLENGQVWSGEEFKGELQGGEMVLEDLAPGPHTLRISSGRYEASASFEISPGSCPVVSGPIKAKELKVVLVATLGDLLRIQSSLGPAKVSLDGQPSGELGPDGLELKAVAQGSHILSFGEGQNPLKLDVEVGSAPVFKVLLSSDRNVGSLLVVTGEDNAQVWLDNKPYARPTSQGKILISNRAVKKYVVRVVKDGFESNEPQQEVEIRKGEQSRLEFHLHPLPGAATVAIRDALPEAQVLLDGKELGSVQADGSFSMPVTVLGQHTLEIRKLGYAPFKRIQKEFVAGKALQVDGEEFGPPQKAWGTVQFSLSPPDCRLTYRNTNESVSHPVSGNRIELPEGVYSFTASSPGHEEKIESIRIVAGQTQTLAWRLAPAQQGSYGMEKWEDAAGWKSEKGWRIHRGGEYVLYAVTPLSGSIEFHAAVIKTGVFRKNPLQWFIAYKDPKNHVLFQINRNTFTRMEFVDGKKKDEQKIPIALAQTSESYTVRIQVSPNSVTHQAYDGKKWINLDNWNDTNQDLSAGKFGFLISGNDEVGISNFSFQPK